MRERIVLLPGAIAVTDEDALIATRVQRGLVVCLYDRLGAVAGTCHILEAKGCRASAGERALPTLLALMCQRGSRPRQLRATLFGGSGALVQPTRRWLARQRIRTAYEDIGGEVERSLMFHARSGEIAVVKRPLRAGVHAA